ncbi:flagellar hook-basal body complex protein FliE [Nocardioides psychrotolerans]|uniref:Flagellar hook-basal body complex protein FliE n=2 Tax=Nocardioides psychrotolerans TaxID=1005945 RepID=A0A1I3Q598_9ACTN|nr:flagellar hook-basal body complex protein FliE [Nocardioides psychrotolerans]
MMSVSGIEAMGFTPYVAPQVPSTPAGSGGVGGAGSAAGVQGASFGDLVLDGLDRLEGVQDRSDQLAVKAATGDLQNLHDYTIAATEATVTTQMTVAVRNKAVEAFTEIMRMQV